MKSDYKSNYKSDSKAKSNGMQNSSMYGSCISAQNRNPNPKVKPMPVSHKGGKK